MDEPTGGEIRRGDAFNVAPVSSDDLEPRTIELIEELCRRFKLDVGLARLELDFLDGAFQFAWRHERVQLARLAEAYEPSRDTSSR